SAFRDALSRFASGVTVVTTAYDGHWHGLTVSAFSSLSLGPPLVLVCIEKSVKSHNAIARAEKFAVNILRADQEPISARFASRAEDKFAGIATHTGMLGIPLIDGALANVECRLHETLAGGDHTIFVGEVVAAEVADGEPLLYFRSAYRHLR
ncbi:MAG TPA: flavin reductase family protein, partial [Thermoanaerobaculia bacterium]